MEFIRLGSIVVALAISLALTACHYYSNRLNRATPAGQERLASFAGGVAVAYVFLHMLPELVEGNEAVGRVVAEHLQLTPLYDLSVFLVALLSFNLYFGLEHLAARSAQRGNSLAAYRLHLALYGLHNALITYTMPLRVQTGIVYALVFTAAMGLNFSLHDRHFNQSFPRQFDHGGRLFLAGSLLLGWLASAITDPINVLAVSLMIAFLSGSIIFGVFRSQLPDLANSRYGWFSGGLLGTAAVLAWQAWMRGGH